MTDEWWPDGYARPAFTVQRERFGPAVGGDYVRAHPGYKLPAYLTPTVGTVTTPDPGPLPNEFIIVATMRATATAGNKTLVSQDNEAAQRALIVQRQQDGNWFQTTWGSAGLINPVLGQVSTSDQDQTFAFTTQYLPATSQLRNQMLQLVDGDWLPVAAPTVNAFTGPIFNSTSPIRVGAHGTASQLWDGRIHSVELLTGLDPGTDERYLSLGQGTVTTPDTSDMDFITPMRFTFRAQIDEYGDGFPTIISKIGPGIDDQVVLREYMVYGHEPSNNQMLFSTGAPDNLLGAAIANPTPLGTPHTFGIEIIPGTSTFTSIVDGVRTTVDLGSPIIPPDNYADLVLGHPELSGRLYWAQLDRLDEFGNATATVWKFNADEAPTDATTTVWRDVRGRKWTVSDPEAISGRTLWKFDAGEYPGTGTSYEDPRGRTWTLTADNAITLAQDVPGVTTLAQTALRYSTTVPGFEAVKGKAYLAIRPWLRLPAVHYKGTVKDDYGSAQIAWGWPVGLEEKWSEVVLVRSGFGDPITVSDGETVFRSPKEGYLDQDGKLTLPPPVIIDQPLQSGHWYYYSLFFKTGPLDWVLGMTGNVQIPRDYHHSEHLWEAIPPYYQYADANIREGNGFLRQILSIFGYELDTARQYVESWQECYHIDKTPVPLLKRVGENFGEAYRGGIGVIRYRGMIAALPEALQMRGTVQAMQQIIEGSSKWLCETTLGSNLMLLPDDSDFGHGTGSWGTLHPDTDDVDEASSLPPTRVIILQNSPTVSVPPPEYGRASMRIQTLKVHEMAQLCITCGSGQIVEDWWRGPPSSTVRTNIKWFQTAQGVSREANGPSKGTGLIFNTWRVAADGIGGEQGAGDIRNMIPLYNGISIDERVTYGFSFQVKMEIPSDVLPVIYWFGADGQPSGLILRSSGIEVPPPNTDWAAYHVSGTAPLGAVYLVPGIVFRDRPNSAIDATYSPYIDIAGAMVYRLGSQGAVKVNPPDSYLTLGEPTEIIGDKEAADTPPEFTQDYWIGSPSTTGLPPVAPS